MSIFRALHHVDHNQAAYGPDEIVRFTDEELARYEASRTGPVAELLAAGAIAGERPRADVPPAEQSVEQLAAIVAGLGLPVATPLDRVALLATLAEARTRLAAPPPSNTPPLPAVGDRLATANGTVQTPSDPAPATIPELAADMDRARLVEIATAHRVEFASNVTAARLRDLIEAARAERAGAAA